MGKMRGRKNWRGGRGGDRRPARADYSEIIKSNKLFEEYYNGMRLFEEEEKKSFWAALRRDLPNSFRFTGSKAQALPVQQLLKDHYIPQITSILHNGDNVTPPAAISWFPDQLAWQMTTPKNIVRRFPPFASFQKFLVSETTVGNISRQEAVSMIPPLVMDIKPGMTVLDMCAAPGSKAAQLLEMIHGGEESRVRKVLRQLQAKEGRQLSPEPEIMREEIQEEEEAGGGDWSDEGRATGLLIANDAEYKRAHMLTHQMKRLNSPNIIVTNHDATQYPSIKLPHAQAGNGVAPKGRYLKFDRILADVPCSGDGTARKNINVWKDWTPGNALGLYPTQVRILVRALQMLKVGGRVVYSTCSMNPVENEAVIATAVERCGGLTNVHLIDCSDKLPLLERRPGLTAWSVMDKAGRMWSSWAQVEDERAQAGDDGLGKLAPSMFPPPDASQTLHLDRCMRIYPHQQDTGAFFICVLEKQSEIKVRPEEGVKAATANSDDKSKSSDAVVDKDAGQAKSGQPSTAILDIVNELESTDPTNKGSANDSLPEIKALDTILPPNREENDDVSTAARQNRENAPSHPTEEDSVEGSLKRKRDAVADEHSRAKKLRVREEVDDPAPDGAEDRQVHWPPPPAANLEASRPEAIGSTMSGADVPTEMETAAATTTAMATHGTNLASLDVESKAVNGEQDQSINPPTTSTTSASTSATAPTANVGGVKKKASGPTEEPFIYLAPTQPELEEIQKFYSLHPAFPLDRFMVRNPTGTPQKTIYYTSALSRDILTANASTGIKFVHCGVKMFVKQDVQAEGVCPWRIQSEGLSLVAGWVGRGREVRLWRKRTLCFLLTEMFPKVEGGGWRDLGEIGERVRDIEMGCCVLRVGPRPPGMATEAGVGVASGGKREEAIEHNDDEFDASQRMTLPVWRSLHSLNLMLPKEDRRAMLLRLYDDESPLKDSSKERFAKRGQQQQQQLQLNGADREAEVVLDVDAGTGGPNGADLSVEARLEDEEGNAEDEDDEDEEDEDRNETQADGVTL